MSKWCLRALGSSRNDSLFDENHIIFNDREKERDSFGTSFYGEKELSCGENIGEEEGFSRHRPRTVTTRKIFKPETGTFQKVKVFKARDYCSLSCASAA